jgi:hypothetical protein
MPEDFLTGSSTGNQKQQSRAPGSSPYPVFLSLVFYVSSENQPRRNEGNEERKE